MVRHSLCGIADEADVSTECGARDVDGAFVVCGGTAAGDEGIELLAQAEIGGRRVTGRFGACIHTLWSGLRARDAREFAGGEAGFQGYGFADKAREADKDVAGIRPMPARPGHAFRPRQRFGEGLRGGAFSKLHADLGQPVQHGQQAIGSVRSVRRGGCVCGRSVHGGASRLVLRERNKNTDHMLAQVFSVWGM